ncbi:MAG: metalloregulator ArsR/SmtB family transcription factor [Deltaproteobacteria bacterium]|nr:metalloregulator ArsR/SmtB family transcription factor [Deltaproteobacteria bacterium]MBW2697737.1 metalloregulator ArsR/SmtB family transcription factor [Deltaproteobacteria bacterium]
MRGNRADELQRIFKTLSDPTRMRILCLLEREELVVQELMEVLGMAQSRVSRHLAILREAGLLSDRRDGTYVFYRFVPPAEGAWRDGWALVHDGLAGDPTAERDDALLRQVIEARSAQARNFFDAVGPEWDALRKVFNDDVLRARAIDRLVTPGLRVADVGTGTGILATELARLGLDVVGIDHSARMLEAARGKLEAQSFPAGGRVELRRGEADRIPLDDASMDAAFAHMVLHYVPSPADVVREMARIVKAGGALVVVDFVQHGHEWMKQELGVLWMGFSADDVCGWFEAAGLPDVQLEESESVAHGRDLPATFIASARLPARREGLA